MKRAKGTEYSVRRNPSGATPVHRSTNARDKRRDSATPLTTRALDYEGRIADLQAKIHELEESRATLAARLRLSEDVKESVEGIHHSWVAMFDSLADPIFLHDAQGRIVRANRAYAELAGMDVKNIIGRRYWEVLPHRDGPLPGCALISAKKQETAEEDVTLETGETYHCRLSSLRDPAGGYICSLHVMQDVTERKLAQQELEFRNVILSTQQEASLDGILVVDGQGKITSFNRRFIEIWGITQEVVESHSDAAALQLVIEKLVDPEAFLARVKYLYEHSEEKSSEEIELKDGRILERYSAPMFGVEGRYYGRVWYFRDITERKRMEMALRHEHDFISAIMDASGALIVVLDKVGRIVRFNPTCEKISGYRQDEVRGKTVWDLLLMPDEVDGVKAVFTHLLARQFPNQHQNHWRARDGRQRLIMWSNTAQLDAHGDVEYVICTGIDVTEHKAAEDALRNSELRFRNLVETNNDLVWEVDENTRYTYVSPRMRDLLGYAPEELIGTSPFDLMPPEEARRVEDAFAPFSAERLPFFRLENTNLHKDGRPVVLETNGAPFFDENGVFRGYRGIDRDITKRKEAEHALHKINRALKTLSACNESLVHAMDEQELLAAICEVIVHTGGYRFAWVGYAQHDETKSVRAMAYAGHEAGYLQTHITSWSDGEHGQGPIGTAIRSGAPDVIRNLREDPRFLLWREEALRRGYASCITLPLRTVGMALGGLSIYASEPDAFNDEEAKLLMELADNLTYGIVALRTRAESERAMEENRQNAARLEQVLIKTIESIGSALEKRDPYTSGHQHRVARLAHDIAQEMKLPQKVVEGIYMGGLIHDIGKIYVPAEILSRPGRLSEAEFNLIKTHPQVGYDIVKGIEFPWPITQMILQHHERLDGSGYPQGLKDGEIALEAKILAVADVVEAMASHRPYRPGLGLDKALNEISKNRGILYDLSAVDACLRLFQEKGFKFE